ncbi:hypothetical protein ACQP2T_54655 [Nonomuraea sp. CA-143628]|uniref:hypothetical protein n=1 Tax=Nonomuraea sp. CA-143628 TaxID=3239997 RepID=UPI003D90C516
MLPATKCGQNSQASAVNSREQNHPGHWARVELNAAREIPETQRREARSDHFIVPDPAVVAGQRIVVLEDTWVQGGHSQSAAAALLLAGASEVTVVVVARRIRPDFRSSLLEASLQRILTDREYSLDICPITGSGCHWRHPAVEL